MSLDLSYYQRKSLFEVDYGFKLTLHLTKIELLESGNHIGDNYKLFYQFSDDYGYHISIDPNENDLQCIHEENEGVEFQIKDVQCGEKYINDFVRNLLSEYPQLAGRGLQGGRHRSRRR